MTSDDADWHIDAALLEAWRGGDDRAGERLFDRHADAVVRFFENKVRDGPEDLTQTTFLRMLESKRRVREGVAFRAFVIGIARNVLREHMRELARGRAVDPEVDSMANLAPGPSSSATPAICASRTRSSGCSPPRGRALEGSTCSSITRASAGRPR